MNDNFISVEEFLKQSEKVQEVLIEWWKPQIGNLYCDDKVCVKCILGNNMVEWINTDKEYKSYIPLLQMHQLMQFIEDKKECKLDIVFDIFESGYNFEMWSKQGNVKKDNGECRGLGDDLLQALWQAIIQIVEKTEGQK